MNFIKKIYPILIAFLISLIPVFWAPGGMLIAGGDDSPNLNPVSFLKISAWDEGAFASNYSTGFARIFPYGVFFWSFQKLGFELYVIQKIWLFSLWFLAGLSIIYLLKYVFPKNYKPISVFALLLYLLNPFNIFIPLTISIRYVHAFLPLVLGVFMRILGSTSFRDRFYYTVLFGVVSFFSATAFSNVANGFVIILACLLYFIYFSIFQSKNKFSANLLFLFLALFLFFITNLHWIWVYFNPSPVKDFVASFNWGFFGTSSLFDSFRTLGGWAFAKDEMTVFEHSYYESLGVLLATFLPIFLAFFSLLLVKKNKNLFFYILLAGIGLFLIKGTLPPWGELYKWSYENILYFKVFREPWTKFMPLYEVAVSVLFGYSCAHFTTVFMEKRKILGISFAAFFIILVFVGGYPSLFGVNLWRYNFSGQRSALVKIPNYWKEMVSFLDKEDRESVVYITPRNFSARDYMWESGSSGLTPIEYLFLENPLRYSNFAMVTQDLNYTGFFILNGDLSTLGSPAFINFLNMLGVKYIIQENDISWGPGSEGNYPPKVMAYFLATNTYLEELKQFGNISVYKVKEAFYKPIIYPSTHIIRTTGPSYAISSWNHAETEPFSLLSGNNVSSDIEYPSFSLSKQLVLQEHSLNAAGDTKRDFEFYIDTEGFYSIYVNLDLSDSRDVSEISILYGVDNFEPQKVLINVSEDEAISKYLRYLKSPDFFKNMYLGEHFFSSGKHILSLDSAAFERKVFTGFNYVVLNKYLADKDSVAVPAITFNKISDTRYIVTVEKAFNPYILNFAQDFNEHWVLIYKDASLDVPHFVVNGVNNGWYISPGVVNGDSSYTLVLEFSLQKDLMLSIYIASGASCALSVVFIILLFFRRRHSFDD